MAKKTAKADPEEDGTKDVGGEKEGGGKSGKSVCMRGCAINSVWIPAGTIIDSKDVKGSSHFREI